MSKLLINESPLMVLPSLAAKIGLNEAMFLQQLHYLTGISKNERDGRTWVFNSYSDWEVIYPFWSQATLKRIVANLKSLELIIVTHKYNRMKIDKTNWFSIDYDKLDQLSRPSDQFETSQSDTSTVSSCNHGGDQNDTVSSDQNDTTNNHQMQITKHKITSLDKSDKSPSQKFDAMAYLMDQSVPYDLAEDFIKHRKATKSMITKRVIDNIASQAAKANYTLEQAIDTLITKGWKSFNADWVNKPQAGAQGTGGFNYVNKQVALEQSNMAALEEFRRLRAEGKL